LFSDTVDAIVITSLPSRETVAFAPAAAGSARVRIAAAPAALSRIRGIR